MKNNPFLPWGMPDKLMGRKDEQKLLPSFISDISTGRSRIMVVQGPPGMGKTTLLKLAESEAKAEKLFNAFIKAGKKEKESGVVRALKAELEDNISIRSQTGEIVFGKARQFSQENAGTFNQLLAISAKATGNGNIILIIDDFDKIQKPKDVLRGIVKAVERRHGVGFILSSTKRLPIPAGVTSIELGAVDEHDFREYVEKLTKDTAKMGEECQNYIYRDSGGNPRMIQLMCWYLFNRAKEAEKIITRAHYSANLRGILGLLSHEWFGEQYFKASDEEKKILKRFANMGETAVTAVAKSIGKKPGPVATLILRLEERGDVVKVKRGTYKVFSPLFGKYVLERS